VDYEPYEDEPTSDEITLDALKAVELEDLEKRYGVDAVATYKKLLAAPTAEEQFKLINSVQRSAPRVPDGGLDDETANAILTSGFGPTAGNPVLQPLPKGFAMSDAAADRILAQFSAPSSRRRPVMADITQHSFEEDE
jgi:hypothetical protein